MSHEICMIPPRKHRTKRVKYKDQEANVDIDIADLVLNLWKLGLHTLHSCQDNVPQGFIWIEFFSAGDAEEFLDFIAEYSEDLDSVYQRMCRQWGDKTPLDWQYEPHLRDYGVDERIVSDNEISSKFTGTHQFQFSMSVRFPRADLEFVKERMRTAL